MTTRLIRQYKFLSSQSYSTKSILQAKNKLRLFKGDSDRVELLLPNQIPSDNIFAKSGRTAILTLRNITAKNAMTGKMMAELSDKIDILEKEKLITTLVVQGSDDWFCSGADLKIARDHLCSIENAEYMNCLMVDNLTRLRNLSLISVAVIRGGAVGGGAELCLSCDFRILESTGFIQFIHKKLGVSPGWGGATRLTRLVGFRNALQLLGKSLKTTSESCLKYGLVDSISSKSNLDSTTFDFIAEYCQGDIESIRSAKSITLAAENLSFKESLDFEKQKFLSLWGQKAHLDALKLALDKGNKVNKT